MEPHAGFEDALTALQQALEDLAAPAMFIGGIAVIALGVPRYTADLDATVLGRDTPPERLFEVFARHEIVPRIERALEFARAHQVLLARHEPSRRPPSACGRWNLLPLPGP